MGGIKNIFQNIRSQKRSNWKAIVLSILAASVFWLFQSLNKNYSTNLSYPIAFDFPVEQYVIMEELPDEIQINISGIGWNIFRNTFSLALNPLRVHLENPASTPKIIGAGLLASVNDQLPDFKVNYIISDTLYLNIEHKISRTFGLSVDSLAIDLKNNFKITSRISISQDSVIISGPKSIITELPAILPLDISRNRIDESFDELVTLQVRGYQQSLLTKSPEDINVQFDVEEYVTVSYKAKLTELEDIDSDIYAIDSTVNVIYSIPRSAQASINKDEILVVALPETLNKEDSTVQLAIQSYPDVISSISLDSASMYMKVIYE